MLAAAVSVCWRCSGWKCLLLVLSLSDCLFHFSGWLEAYPCVLCDSVSVFAPLQVNGLWLGKKNTTLNAEREKRWNKAQKRWRLRTEPFTNCDTAALGYFESFLRLLDVLGLADLRCEIFKHRPELFFSAEHMHTVSVDRCVTVTRPVWNSARSGSCLWSGALLSFNKSSPVTAFSALSLSPSPSPPSLSLLISARCLFLLATPYLCFAIPPLLFPLPACLSLSLPAANLFVPLLPSPTPPH